MSKVLLGISCGIVFGGISIAFLAACAPAPIVTPVPTATFVPTSAPLPTAVMVPPTPFVQMP